MTRAPRTLVLSLMTLGVACSDSHRAPDLGQLDGGPLTLSSCFAGLAPREEGRFVGTLDFESLDGELRVRIAREPGERSAIGETYPYDLVRFAIERDGVVECITDPSALGYDFGHHNWDDTATAEGAATYALRSRYDVAADPVVWIDTLQIDGAAPIPLRATACDVTPLDLNHCLLRSFP